MGLDWVNESTGKGLVDFFFLSFSFFPVLLQFSLLSFRPGPCVSSSIIIISSLCLFFLLVFHSSLFRTESTAEARRGLGTGAAALASWDRGIDAERDAGLLDDGSGGLAAATSEWIDE